ncbi:MAG: hypothetical protein WBL35_12250, partial [Ornithinibacter sp.]
TYAVVAAGIVAAWWVVGHRRARLAGLVASLAVAFVVVAGFLQLWAGPHVYDQLQRSRRAVSLATPWRVVLETLGPVVGFAQTRELISIGAALLAVVLAVSLLLVSRPAGARQADPPVDPGPGPISGVGVVALWVTGCLALAYSLAASYSLPWYDVLVWAALPAVASGLVDGVALMRLTALAVAYVPGRVLGMSTRVEDLTLGLRRGVAPWVVVLLWLVVIGAGVRTVWRRRRGPRPGDRTPSPTR